MHQVIYFSRGGNTKMIAEAIASELRTKAVVLSRARIDPEGILFLGSGCYGGDPGPRMMEFIENTDLSGRKVALFRTSGGGKGDGLGKMEEALKGKGATILGNYDCKGRTFLLINMKHPDEDDISKARKFAREMISNLRP